ncbi:MAG: hypothetical protein AAF570_19465 [Bacteroidota bacterium]
MKVGELRKILAHHKKEDLIKIAVEFYKAVPKAKKEDHGLDEIAQNPNQKRESKSSLKTTSLRDLKAEIEIFIENVRYQHYIFPNSYVRKAERSKWRFKVKNWYKELTNPELIKKSPTLCEELLSGLYDVMCESFVYEYFTAYDAFASIGVQQTTFFTALMLQRKSLLAPDQFVARTILTILDNELGRETLCTDFMLIFIGELRIPDMKNLAIDVARELHTTFAKTPKKIIKHENVLFSWAPDDYAEEARHNNLVELILLLYFSLFEYGNGIAFFQEHYEEHDPEVKLYMLVIHLLDHDEPQKILEVIATAKQQDVEPREALLDLETIIEETGELPIFG